MTKALLLVLVATAVASAQTPADIGGWREARWGMTDDQVLAAFPGEAMRMERPELLPSGSECRAWIPRYNVQTMEFEVLLCFGHAGLALVKLSTPTSPDVLRGIGINMAWFKTLEELLTVKYGQPTSITAPATVLWARPDTTIRLSHTYLMPYRKSKGYSFLTLSYAPPSKEVDKL